MSQDVDRNQVFQTTRVRTPLKNDVSWIQKPKKENKETNNERTNQDVETNRALVRLNSYVLSTAKKFESVDSPPSPALQNTQSIPSESDSANQANGEAIPPHKDAQPEGSTVETTDETKPQAPTGERMQNGDAHTENSTAENKDNADTKADQSDIKHIEEVAEVSAEVILEECVQNAVTHTNPEAVSSVEPAEQPVVTTTEEINVEYINTVVDQSDTAVHVEECIQSGEAQPVSSVKEIPEAEPAEQPVVEDVSAAADQSNTEQNEVKASAHVEVAASETSAADGSEETKDSADILAAEEPTPHEESKTEPETATILENTEVESPVQAADEIVQAVALVAVDSSPDERDVINAPAGEEPALQNSVEPVPDLLAQSELAAPPAAETSEGSREEGPSDQTSGETAEAAAEVDAAILPEAPAVTGTAGEEAGLGESVEPVPDLVGKAVFELPTQPAAETATEETEEIVVAVRVEASLETSDGTDAAPPQDSVEPDLVTKSVPPTEPIAEVATEGSTEDGPPGEAGETVVVVRVETSHDTSDGTDTAPPQDSVEPDSSAPPQPAAEAATDGSSEDGPPGETVEPVVEYKVESLPETPAVAGNEAATPDNVDPVPDIVADTVSKTSALPAAETAVQSVEVQSADPVSPAKAEEVVEPEVQPVHDSVVEQSVQPTPESASDNVVELNINDAFEPATPSDDKSVLSPIELTDALDVPPPAAEAAPESQKEPEQSPQEESDHAKNFKAPCYFCDKDMDENVRLIFTDPLMNCHPDCLKCGVCIVALGDLLAPIYLHNQVIQCDGCFRKTLET